MWSDVSLSTDLANVIYFRCIFVRVLHDLLRKYLLHESAMVSYFRANLVNTGVNNFSVQLIFKSFRSFISSVVWNWHIETNINTRIYIYSYSGSATHSVGNWKPYILHLLAFVEIRLFNVFLWERKAGFGKLLTNVRDAGFSRKRGGNAGSGPPFQTLYYQRHTLESWFTNLEQTLLNRSQ